MRDSSSRSSLSKKDVRRRNERNRDAELRFAFTGVSQAENSLKVQVEGNQDKSDSKNEWLWQW